MAQARFLHSIVRLIVVLQLLISIALRLITLSDHNPLLHKTLNRYHKNRPTEILLGFQVSGPIMAEYLSKLFEGHNNFYPLS